MSKDPMKTDINQTHPRLLSEVIGQKPVVDYLKLSLDAYFNIRAASQQSDVPFGPVLFAGPSGTGKTLIANIVHAELGNDKLIETNGQTLMSKTELYSVLIGADANSTVFIDEAQGLNTAAQHILLTALSEKKLYVPAAMNGSGSCALPLTNFTTLMASTHEYLLQDALRNRMRIYCRFEYYSIQDLIEIVRQRITALKWEVESDDVLQWIAQGCKHTPRLALNRNLMTAWHVTLGHRRKVITLEDVKEAFFHLQIDRQGLDQVDRSYLRVVFESKRTSLSVLSSVLSLPAYTIQRIVEPYLFKRGFVRKDGSLRVLTETGRKYIQNSGCNEEVL